MGILIADENGISNFVDDNHYSGFVDQDGDFFASDTPADSGVGGIFAIRNRNLMVIRKERR